MNYRHAFHAGNFADVVKHAVLARVVAQLREKQTAFRIIDTHAGAGVTDLTGPEASRTGEWRNGIGRLVAAELEPPIRALLAPYLDAVAGYNPPGRLRAYPGSPLLAASWLRPQDRLIACEVVPQAARALTQALQTDRRAKVIPIDGWTALAAYLPPKERRGLVLIDPPFEAPGELDRLPEDLARAHRKWATGIYLLWYPVKNLPALVPGQKSARGRTPGKKRRRAWDCQNFAYRGESHRPQGRNADRQRASDGQSAVAARNRVGIAASGARGGARPRWRGHVPARPARPGKVRVLTFASFHRDGIGLLATDWL